MLTRAAHRPIPALVLLLIGALLSACAAAGPGAAAPRPAPVATVSAPAAKTRLIVLGMIHGQHRTSERYSTARLAEAIRRIRPDVVLCEIPPDRLDVAREEFARTGTVTEPRVRVFPEYVNVLFPLTREWPIEIVPCAAWTKAMSDDRAANLSNWQTTRAAESAEVDAAAKRSEALLAAESAAAGLSPDDPRFIHTQRYDAITKAGLEPYDRLFNDGLGAGGWTAINKAHYALLARALDAHAGKTVLIMFGAGHKYWFLEQLRTRPDIELVDPRGFFGS